MDGANGCPPKKRAAATKPATNIAWWFCNGRSVPCFPGRNGHLYGQTESLPLLLWHANSQESVNRPPSWSLPVILKKKSPAIARKPLTDHSAQSNRRRIP